MSENFEGLVDPSKWKIDPNIAQSRGIGHRFTNSKREKVKT